MHQAPAWVHKVEPGAGARAVNTMGARGVLQAWRSYDVSGVAAGSWWVFSLEVLARLALGDRSHLRPRHRVNSAPLMSNVLKSNVLNRTAERV